MKLSPSLLVALIGLSPLAPAAAQDSVGRASAASVEASVQTGASAAWIAHAGSEFTVHALRTSAQGVELSLRSASGAVETSAIVAGDLAEAASVGIGTSVRVVVDSTGTMLIAAGRVLAFVPNEIGRALLHRARH
ncbi:MAG: hypothetical protein HYS35_01565 [Betaproteobacteria bacterium]|nr:hypothetical protein [Betaproteobacteria bacterium]